MKIQLYLGAAVAFATLALNACGSSNSSPTPVYSATPSPASTQLSLSSGGTVTTSLGSGSATVKLPTSSGSGSVAVVASTSAPASAIALNAANSESAARSTAGTDSRFTRSAGAAGSSYASIDPLFYLQIAPTSNITYTSGTISGTYASSDIVAGDEYALSLYIGALGFWETGPASKATQGSVAFSYDLVESVTVSGGTTYIVALSKVVP